LDKSPSQCNPWQRVYFRYLGETLQLFCRSTGTTDALEDLAPDRLAQIAEDLGEEYYSRKIAAVLPSDYDVLQPASNWWTDMSDGQKCFWFAAILLMLLSLLSRG
jgi:hypothetical protein